MLAIASEEKLFTSPRNLLALVRLSTAFARLRLSATVDVVDVDAAVDLLKYALDGRLVITERLPIEDALKLDGLLASMLQSPSQKISYSEFLSKARQDGFHDGQIDVFLRNQCDVEKICFEGLSIENLPNSIIITE